MWILNLCLAGSNLGMPWISFFLFFFFLIFLFIIFFYVFLSLLLQCKFANSTLLSLLSFSNFITPYDAQASSAFSALIPLSIDAPSRLIILTWKYLFPFS